MQFCLRSAALRDRTAKRSYDWCETGCFTSIVRQPYTCLRRHFSGYHAAVAVLRPYKNAKDSWRSIMTIRNSSLRPCLPPKERTSCFLAIYISCLATVWATVCNSEKEFYIVSIWRLVNIWRLAFDFPYMYLPSPYEPRHEILNNEAFRQV